MESYVFWDKLVEAHELYESTGMEQFMILDMSGGMELILRISTVDVLDSDKEIYGVLSDGTEIVVSISEVCTLRYNHNWTFDDVNLLVREDSVI